MSIVTKNANQYHFFNFIKILFSLSLKYLQTPKESKSPGAYERIPLSGFDAASVIAAVLLSESLRRLSSIIIVV